jgi:hypothetical protein
MTCTANKLPCLALAVTFCLSPFTTLADTAVDQDLPVDTDSSLTVDFNEQTHLQFMREEEKLARDVYLTLGSLYPDSAVFGNIDDSEQRHTSAVRDMLEKYGIDDPNTNDNIGVYTGAEYGDYFTEKYQQLVASASNSEYDAWLVGALIEELDMYDINLCPKIIVQMDNGIDDESACGKIYTDNSDIHHLYDSLLEGSENHLRAYVQKIEQVSGEGSYRAQYLDQTQVDALLGR